MDNDNKLRAKLEELAKEFDQLFKETLQRNKFSESEIRRKRKRMREVMIEYADLEQKLGIFQPFIPPKMGG